MTALPTILPTMNTTAIEAALSREGQLRDENATLRKELTELTSAVAAMETGGDAAADAGGARGMKAPRLSKEARARFAEIDAAILADSRKRRLLVDDIEWVLDHVDNEGPDGVKAIEAPGRAAWSMLWVARSNRMKFYEKFVPMLQKRQELSGPELSKGGLGVTDDDEGLEIERLKLELRKAVKASGAAA